MVSTGMGDRLRAGEPPRFVTSHLGQLRLLSSAGRENEYGQSAVTLCGLEVKVGIVHSSVLFCSLAVLDPRVGHTMDVLSPFISVLCHSD